MNRLTFKQHSVREEGKIFGHRVSVLRREFEKYMRCFRLSQLVMFKIVIIVFNNNPEPSLTLANNIKQGRAPRPQPRFLHVRLRQICLK